LGEDDGDEPAVQQADGKAPRLAAGERGFDLKMRQGEDRDCVEEIDTVLGDVGGALGFVLLEFGRHVAIYVATCRLQERDGSWALQFRSGLHSTFAGRETWNVLP
jgi:hypothetical protein